MDKIALSKIVSAIKTAKTPEAANEILRQAINKSKSADSLLDCREFIADDKRPRFTATTSTGEGLVLPGPVPAIGDLYEAYNRTFFVETHWEGAEQPDGSGQANQGASA